MYIVVMWRTHAQTKKTEWEGAEQFNTIQVGQLGLGKLKFAASGIRFTAMPAPLGRLPARITRVELATSHFVTSSPFTLPPSTHPPRRGKHHQTERLHL